MPEAAKIPIIDISSVGENEASQLRIAKDLVDAAVEYGFVYVRNTGNDISAGQVEKAFGVSRTLFDCPLEDKQRCKIGKNNRGWSGMHSETLDPKTQRVGDFKEGFNFGPFTPTGEATQPVPQGIVPHEAFLASFQASCHALCRRLLHLFGIGLAVSPPDFFTRAHDPVEPSGSILRFLYYPSPAATTTRLEEGDVRAGAHSDYGSITLLFRLRGQAGLEILQQSSSPGSSSSSWAPVPVHPPGTEDDPSPPILVNIGDLLSYWTGGLLRSTVHRVAFSSSPTPSRTTGEGERERGGVEGESSTDPRYSIVYFCHPADATPLEPVPSERVRSHARNARSVNGDGNPYARRDEKVLTADEHLQMRLRATYLDMYGNGNQ